MIGANERCRGERWPTAARGRRGCRCLVSLSRRTLATPDRREHLGKCCRRSDRGSTIARSSDCGETWPPPHARSPLGNNRGSLARKSTLNGTCHGRICQVILCGGRKARGPGEAHKSADEVDADKYNAREQD